MVEHSIEETEFSKEILTEYVNGCSEIGLSLDAVTKNILQNGKKPVILIPSRGAVPIFLLAQETLRAIDPEHRLVNPRRVAYHPRNIFEHLSGKRINTTGEASNTALENSPKSEVDVLLYPCTSDVSVEPEAGEQLARELRGSCTRVFRDLIFRNNPSSLDLSWHFFLMSKMHPEAFGDLKFSPQEIVQQLRGYKGVKNGQPVLVDTVISGRAASDIITAFASAKRKVAAVLAVDTRGGIHFRPEKVASIRKGINWVAMGAESAFKYLPLITEDKGAALLGLSALNFTNFNRHHFFHEVDPKFSEDFMPQSCIYTLPPGHLRREYTAIFQEFMELCSKQSRGEDLGDLPSFLRRLRPFVATTHTEVDQRDIKELFAVEGRISAKETHSHIISVTLSDRMAWNWVREFSDIAFREHGKSTKRSEDN